MARVFGMRGLPLLLPVIAAACAIPGAGPDALCTGTTTYAITLAVRDSVTLAPAAAQASVTGSVATTFGTYQVNGQMFDSVTVVVGTLPGTYDLTIRAAGYSPWRKNHVVVDAEDACHPKPVAIQALLVPASSTSNSTTFDTWSRSSAP